MSKLRNSKVLCGTISAVFVLALMVATISHGPVFPPDDDTTGGNIIAHGPVFPPDDDTNGGNVIGHGPVFPPDDDTNGGNVRFV